MASTFLAKLIAYQYIDCFQADTATSCTNHQASTKCAKCAKCSRCQPQQYKCDQCGKTYQAEGWLKRHLQSVHGKQCAMILCNWSYCYVLVCVSNSVVVG